MAEELKACPFCGGVPKTSHRPESKAAGGGHKAFVVCYCGGYASTAHQMGHAETVQAAIAEAVEKWNTRSQLPSQGGEAVEVVAHLVLGGFFHGGSGPELGDIDYQIEVDVAERLQRENVKTSEDVQLELMTVAQHQRIMAATHPAAQVAEGVAVKLREAFPLFDETGLSETEHHCEWNILQERKRLHSVLDALLAKSEGANKP